MPMTNVQLARITNDAMDLLKKGDKVGAVRLVSKMSTNDMGYVMKELSAAMRDRR